MFSHQSQLFSQLKFQHSFYRVIIAGLTKEQMEIVITAKKLKKTRHILGIVKGDKPKHYEIFINTLYWGGGLVHAAGWRGRAFTTVSLDYFPDKISNLRQNPLNVITFEFPPSIIYHRDSEGKLLYRYGWDVSVVEALAQAFNFTIVYKEPPPDERWGDKQPNGTWSGMIGQFSRDEGDVGIANLYITNRQGRRNHQDFSTPFGDDKSCYLARVEPPLPHWMSLALPFQTTAWIASMIGLIITGPILYLIARASAKSKYEERHLQSLSYSILYVIGDLLRQPSGSLPLRTSTQIFVVFLGLACMILTIAYTSNLTAFLTVTRHPKGVETIKELYESGKMVFDLNPFFQRYMSGSENRYLRALSERFESIPNYDDIQPKVLDGEGVMIQSKGYLLYVSAHLAIPQGKPRVRLMKECFSPFSIGIVYQYGSPLKHQFDLVISWMFEAGITNRFFIDAISRSQQLKKQEEKMKETVSPETYEEEEEEGGVIPLGIDHLQGIFIILAFGCFVSTSVFFLELALALFLK
ncbi:hypothetical protein SK128_026464 [Halocaridina rubra]|uniref:Uncharacterized protein n=1 Tax=Halocaridina rubra TaxID=373956 RepID=A0AAN8X9R4_HALRR